MPWLKPAVTRSAASAETGPGMEDRLLGGGSPYLARDVDGLAGGSAAALPPQWPTRWPMPSPCLGRGGRSITA